MIPGWLDKALRHRHRATAHLDNSDRAVARADWIATLLNAKLPDRGDFKHYGDDLARAWRRGRARWRRERATGRRVRAVAGRPRPHRGAAAGLNYNRSSITRTRARKGMVMTPRTTRLILTGSSGLRASIFARHFPKEGAAWSAPFAFKPESMMVSIQLPDGSPREPGPVTVAEVAAHRPAWAKRRHRRRDGNARASSTQLSPEADTALAILTDKDADGLEVIRHSTAHLLAYAVKELFPDAQVTIGPVIENGFLRLSYKRPFTPEDLAAIEAKMAELAKKDEPVVRRVLPRDEAVAYFKGLGEDYKAEIIAEHPARRGRVRCTARASSRICAAARTCPPPAS